MAGALLATTPDDENDVADGENEVADGDKEFADGDNEVADEEKSLAGAALRASPAVDVRSGVFLWSLGDFWEASRSLDVSFAWSPRRRNRVSLGEILEPTWFFFPSSCSSPVGDSGSCIALVSAFWAARSPG